MTASARGLFRATGKAAKPSAIRDLDGTLRKVVDRPREAQDFYPTPPDPTRALLRAEAARLADFPLIWEPSCGDGAMVREIRAAGHACVGTDLVQRWPDDSPLPLTCLDFLQARERLAPAIITNPPYDLVNARDGKGVWIWQAMDRLRVDYMALLLSWSWPAAGGHASLWQTYPPARVYLMRWKIDLTGAGAPPMLNGWFVWDRAHQGETIMRMMDRGDDARQGDLL